MGDFSLLTSGHKVAVVGSRNASEQGIERAEIIACKLVEYGITVVSGLARGIDTVAHTSAIDCGGRTITVLGTALSVASPRANASLLDTIKREHLAISQFPEGNQVYRSNFPIRNRTMALISDATIIVEASESSGTKSQGWEALRLGRHLYFLENVATDPKLTWPKKMIEYGAQVLTRGNLDLILEELPNFTIHEEFVF